MSELTTEENKLVARLNAVEHAKQMKKTNFDKECETVIEAILLDIDDDILVINLMLDCLNSIRVGFNCCYIIFLY